MSEPGAFDPIAVALAFTAVLDRLGVSYLVAGSLASSAHGEPRSTNDIDIVADLQPQQAGPLLQSLGDSYYVSEFAIREALRVGGAFNLIHLDTVMKIDVFIVGSDAFDRERLRMRQPLQVSAEPTAWLFVDTAEHTILRKLEWYRRGGEASERQWRDVVAILRVQGAGLDGARLAEWASRLGVADLLERASAEAREA